MKFASCIEHSVFLMLVFGVYCDSVSLITVLF